jgi:hypothetical protein
VDPLDVLLDEFAPFSDDTLYNEIPFFPLVFPLGHLSKGEDLAMYTSACNQKDRFLTVILEEDTHNQDKSSQTSSHQGPSLP